MTELLYTLSPLELYAEVVAILGQDVVDILIGTLLGDSRLNFIYFSSASAYFEQSTIHAAYIIALYGTLAHLAVKAPKLRFHGQYRKDSSEITSIWFSLRSIPALGILAYLFYQPRSSNKSPYVKDAPWALLPFALTPLALAFWIGDDGSPVNRGGVTLNTQSFTLGGVMALIWALEMHHGLVCSIHTKRLKSGKVGYCIYINRVSLQRLQAIVGPHIEPSFRYKVHL
jgi:hypothetical protein